MGYVSFREGNSWLLEAVKTKVPQILHCLRMLDTFTSSFAERPGFVFRKFWGKTPGISNIAGWKISIFNREYIFKLGSFSPC